MVLEINREIQPAYNESKDLLVLVLWRDSLLKPHVCLRPPQAGPNLVESTE